MMQKLFINNFINFFLICFSILLIVNIFLGKKSIFELNEKQKVFLILDDDYNFLLKKKKKLYFYLSLYNSNKKDFIEFLIKKELNFKEKGEKVFIHDKIKTF
ncbi:hypothetical protein OA848_03470 [Rickettsiales bacterium]|nr:hypothetical protein [Rickettsiales bacterium]